MPLTTTPTTQHLLREWEQKGDVNENECERETVRLMERRLRDVQETVTHTHAANGALRRTSAFAATQENLWTRERAVRTTPCVPQV